MQVGTIWTCLVCHVAILYHRIASESCQASVLHSADLRSRESFIQVIMLPHFMGTLYTYAQTELWKQSTIHQSTDWSTTPPWLASRHLRTKGRSPECLLQRRHCVLVWTHWARRPHLTLALRAGPRLRWSCVSARRDNLAVSVVQERLRPEHRSMKLQGTIWERWGFAWCNDDALIWSTPKVYNPSSDFTLGKKRKRDEVDEIEVGEVMCVSWISLA